MYQQFTSVLLTSHEAAEMVWLSIKVSIDNHGRSGHIRKQWSRRRSSYTGLGRGSCISCILLHALGLFGTSWLFAKRVSVVYGNEGSVVCRTQRRAYKAWHRAVTLPRTRADVNEYSDDTFRVHRFPNCSNNISRVCIIALGGD